MAGRKGQMAGRPQPGVTGLVWLFLVLTAAALACLALGCGDDDQPNEVVVTTPSRPAPPATDFPATTDRSLDQVIKQADPPQNDDPVITPASQVFYPGTNRYSFNLADRDSKEITEAEVALYIAPIPGPEGSGSAYDQPADGPFPARLVSLGTEQQFRSQTTGENPYSATAFYTADLPFDQAGDYRVEALIRHDGRLIAKSLPRVAVGAYRGIPRPGQRPPAISTPTAGAAEQSQSLTTRLPAGDLNEVDFAEALGERPVALLFTSPAFCQSRVCSSVADIAEQVNSEVGDGADVIHMEIYNDNDPDRGVRPQVRRFNLPSDTWLFIAGADGRLQRAVEGPFGAGEMKRWLEEASRG